MFGAFSSSLTTPPWRHHMQREEDSLVRELMEASDVDAVLARMENNHFRHLSPIMRKLTSYEAAASTSPRAGAPPPPPPPELEPSVSRADHGGFGGSGDWDAQSSPSLLQSAYSYAPQSCGAASPASNPLHTSLRDGDLDMRASPAARPPPPPQQTQAQGSSSPRYSAVAHDPLDAYRRPASGTAAAASRPHHHETESRYQSTIDSWLWPDGKAQASRAVRDDERPLSGSRVGPSAATQQVHADPDLNLDAAESGLRPPPTLSSSWSPRVSRFHGSAGAGLPRVTTRVASASPLHSSASRLGASAGDPGELENASQSRIARQLQLLRNYRQLAELCSCTDSPSTDLFRALPSEELARFQAEQLKGLAQREQSPITVNNNYFFGSGSGDKHGSSRRASGVDGRRLRGDNSDPLGTGHVKLSTGAAPGNSRSASEMLSTENRPPAAASHRTSGTSWLQRQRPPLLPSPRAVPLQSPQLSSGPDSPVATPPLSLRGGYLAPPSPSRSQRGRSHCNRLLDAHYTPTATTEEAGSSYTEDDEDADYAGDCMENSGGEDDEDYGDNGLGYRRPPPRIIEREQHRRFPAASSGDDAFPSSTAGGTAQPPLAPATSQLMHERQSSYSGDCVNDEFFTVINEHPLNTSNSPQHGMRSGSATLTPGGVRSSAGNAPGSDGGRRSVCSAINVLAGEQELRNNVQRQNAGGKDGDEPRRTSQRLISAPPLSQQQQRRSLSAASSVAVQCGGGALTDPGASPKYTVLQGPPPGSREHEGSAQGSPTSASRRGGNTERLVRTTPPPEKRPAGESRADGAAASGPQSDGRRPERDGPDGTPCSRRKDGARRGWRRRGADPDDGSSSSNGSEVGSAHSGTSGSDSACDAPGNPQLQTHSPRSSAQNEEQTRRRRSERASSRRRGYDDRNGEDSRTPRSEDRFGRKRASAKTRTRQELRSRRAEGNSNGGGGARRHDEDREAADSARSAASYSFSYTTSTDISDYVPGSYYSPIRSGYPRGSARGPRSGMGSPGRGGRGARGGAFQAPYGGRGREGAMPGPYRGGAPGAAAADSRGEHGESLERHGRRSAIAGDGMHGGVHGPYRCDGGLSPQLVAPPQQSQRSGQRPPIGMGARSLNTAMVDGSAGVVRRLMRLPDGRVIPVTSPEARRYYQAMRMMAAGAPGACTRAPMTVQQRMGYNPGAAVHQSGLPSAAGLGGMPSTLNISPIKGGRAASPSVSPSAAMTTRSHHGAGSSGPHVQPGLLYGSLLPKARPKTALVVEEDEYGRSHSVNIRGSPSQAPLLERGGVCPVESATNSTIQPWRFVSNGTPQVDLFPIIGGAVNGSTNAGVMPLEWKSGGSGCVAGRSGHVPVAPRDKLSSHYVPPGSLKGRNQLQHSQPQPRSATVIAANSPVSSILHLPRDMPAAAAPASGASIKQQGHHALQPADAGQRRSALPLHSSNLHHDAAPAPVMYNDAAQLQRSNLGGSNAQQRYMPLQGSLHGAVRGHHESVLQQQNRPGSSSTTAAARNANLQRFGIAALQG
ncbi:hypothetical protein LSCM1_05046 [Leishmania martiniquensis]|uniref:Uncharacterized protein n=1 Tax=Leishmania martiniquensis TaxID=1580590 RepID=A0A836HJC5_9TRYP|nr:hypothetical protein LSCM1_05046 [Leishmania martiniquensis]